MKTNETRATIVEQLVVGVAAVLQTVGLRRIVYSGGSRKLAGWVLRRGPAAPPVRTIASGLGKGLRLHVTPATPHSYWMGTHEPHALAVVADQIKPGMTVYDCGANIGYFSAVFARLVGAGGRVFAFEPAPESVASLRLMAELNGFPHLQVVPQALWDRPTTVTFASNSRDGATVADHVAGLFGESPAEIRQFEVPATSLDEFVYVDGHPPPDFIKLDVEGAEGRVFAGARRLLGEFRPDILCEIHGEPGREVWNHLTELRYVARDIVTGQVPKAADEFAVWIRQYLAVPIERSARGTR